MNVIMNEMQVLIPVNMDKEEVGNLFENYNLSSAAVIDKNNKLRGARERATVIAEYLASEQFGRKPNHSYSIPQVLNGYALAPGVNLGRLLNTISLMPCVSSTMENQQSRTEFRMNYGR